jgi:MFS transporter, CP family, cyanate transporter
MIPTAPAQLGRQRLWAGRVVVLLGIILVSASLRTAATSLSPIIGAVEKDIPLSALGLGVLGMLPPLLFAAAGLFAPGMARRFGLETSTVIAVAAMIMGFTARALAEEFGVLFGGTLLALAGAGAGNILLPPIVKRYFPDRIGLVTSLYATAVAIGTVLPPALAFPLAEAASWRGSLGVWAILALLSLPPWIIVLAQVRRSHRTAALEGAPELAVPEPELVGRIWHSRVAWSIALAFAFVSFQAYSLFAWLPQLLMDQVGVGALEAGFLLALWGGMGMVAALVAPVLTARLSNVGWILHIGATGFLLGYLGLLFAPGVSPWLWVGLCGVGQIVFPSCLALINLRTRTHAGSIAVSGFVQGIGYLIAALGPLLVGMLHDVTNDWTASIVLLAAVSSVLVYFGIVLRTPRFVEEETAVPRR